MVRKWFGVVRKWFGSGLEVVRKWFGGGSGVARKRLWKDETALTSKIAACQEGCLADDVTTSRDMTALARAGPCAGYERLVLLEALASRGVEFRACASPDDVKTKFEELVVLKKHLAVLMASCKIEGEAEAKGDQGGCRR